MNRIEFGIRVCPSRAILSAIVGIIGDNCVFGVFLELDMLQIGYLSLTISLLYLSDCCIGVIQGKRLTFPSKLFEFNPEEQFVCSRFRTRGNVQSRFAIAALLLIPSSPKKLWSLDCALLS